jgi:hypothetical protein
MEDIFKILFFFYGLNLEFFDKYALIPKINVMPPINSLILK